MELHARYMALHAHIISLIEVSMSLPVSLHRRRNAILLTLRGELDVRAVVAGRERDVSMQRGQVDKEERGNQTLHLSPTAPMVLTHTVML
jgi:hypothetical protein